MKGKILFSILLLLCGFANTQTATLSKKWDLKDLELDVDKIGPYIGLQQGKFSSFEFGVEYQHKNIKLVRPTTYSLHLGCNYNFSNNLLGYDLGYWYKAGRLNLTYGVNAIFRTDYKTNALGFAPVVGFKLGQLHLQTGYNFLSRTHPGFACNSFFMTIRFVLVQYRNFTWKN
jgi:hypothetical protein